MFGVNRAAPPKGDQYTADFSLFILVSNSFVTVFPKLFGVQVDGQDVHFHEVPHPDDIPSIGCHVAPLSNDCFH